MKIEEMREKGITLIALVVTIIILLILVGVTLNMALSGDGLFSMARKAATDYNQKSVEEKLQLMYAEKIMEDVDNNSNTKSDVTDVLEEMAGGEITQKDIEEFNKLLEPYNEEVKGITTVEELAKIGQDEEHPIDGVYVQLSDIERLEKKIGSKEQPFKGIYNGNGKSIKELNITAENDYEGMFAKNEGTIKNVTINNCQINSHGGLIGGIVGENTGLIENCIVAAGEIESKGATGEFKDSSLVGGICGYNVEGGEVRNCKNSADIQGKWGLVGGICGYNFGSNIIKCENRGSISGYYQFGGIAGDSDGRGAERVSLVEDCDNYGKILDNDEDPGYNMDKSKTGGGITGCNFYNSIVRNCCNFGQVETSGGEIGGIAGANAQDIINCKNEGNVSGHRQVGRDCWSFRWDCERMRK